MKALLFLLVATVICVQCNGFTNKCLPRPMREVPVTLEIKNVSKDFASSVCKNNLLAITELEEVAQDQIMKQYQQIFDCELVGLTHRFCRTVGRNTRHVFLYYLTNLTCGYNCYHLGLHDKKNRDAVKFYSTQATILREAYKSKPHSSFSYNDMLVDVFYFNGRKLHFHFNCDDNTLFPGEVNKKIPACRCPFSCTSPCELPSDVGIMCPGNFPGNSPHYYHNATSGKCERFIFGGCGGNQNRFSTRDECESACKGKVCPEGMVYKECGTSCPSTCDNKDNIFPCTLQCVQGCFCEEGTVLLEEDGEVCVASEKCPVTQECPEGMVYQECGTACPTTCDNKDEQVICTQQCVSGCFCNESTVLLKEGGEVCVAPGECPEPECPEGMVYQECGTACPATCDNKNESVICTKQCVPGCFCNESTVLLEEGGEVCVAPEECPDTGSGEECPKGMEYKECDLSCPMTCDELDDEANCNNIIHQCKPGCVCSGDTVLLEAGGDECVAEDECPTNAK